MGLCSLRPLNPCFDFLLCRSWPILYLTIPYPTILHCTIPHVPYHIIPHTTIPYYATSYHTILHEENLLVKLKSRSAESEKVFSKLDLKYQMRKIRWSKSIWAKLILLSCSVKNPKNMVSLLLLFNVRWVFAAFGHWTLALAFDFLLCAL